MSEAQNVLRKYFGYPDFRPGQEKMVSALTEGRDALGIMPTGAGKSICYQVPAMLRTGVTIVVSPLISLMKDQVAALKSSGIPAAYFNSTLTPGQMDLAMERAREGWYRIIYVAPERLETVSFRRLCANMQIALLAVDEAHCVSQWGPNFRPEYLRIADFAESLPQRPPVGAFTATATQRVKDDIRRLLRLQNPETVITGFDRPNLYFEVMQPKERKAALLTLLASRRDRCCIVYCGTRKNVEDICDLLTVNGYDVGRYHAGLSDEERRQTQEDFQADRLQVIVATNAFGMGIDKSNVSCVIHYNMPRSMEAYYQEAGRAGRDGGDAECILLYSPQDIYTARWMIKNGEQNPDLTDAQAEELKRQEERRLQRMIDYCMTQSCLRGNILRYFGETAPTECGNCSGCIRSRNAAAAEAAMNKRRKGRSVSSSAAAGTTVSLPKPGTIVMSGTTAGTPIGRNELFERLRSWRKAEAERLHQFPFTICQDKTLTEIARRKPMTMEDLIGVYGIGETRAERFGEAILKVVREYLDEEAKKQLTESKPKSPEKKAVRRGEWSPEEVALLRNAASEGMLIAEIAKRLNRTQADVVSKLIQLKKQGP